MLDDDLELEEFLDKIENENKPKVLSSKETEKEKFLSQIKSNSPELFPIIEARLKQKELQKENNKEKAKTLAEVTKELLEGDFIKLNDDDENFISINDLLVSRATANLISSKKTTFKDLNEAQKVIKNDTDDNRGGFTLILNTNGQDLGA